MTLSAAECCKGDVFGPDSVSLAGFRGSPRPLLPQNTPRETDCPYSMTRGSISMTSDETSNSSVAWGRPAK